MARPGLVQEEVVDVVEGLPDLLDLVPAERLPTARRALRARSILVRKGRWDAAADAAMVDGGIGFLILDGALIRCVTAAHRTSGELLGPGDLVRCDADFGEDGLPFSSYWRGVSPRRPAVLDARFARTATLVPETTPALMASLARRTDAV